jgi:dTDP-L-rhamnose 4-epimerase
MTKQVLITGGAGFIGSHLADELLRNGYRVRVLDNLSEQVHGGHRMRPDYLADDVELMVGNIADPAAVAQALEGVDAVFHLAAMVGVGQSMYQIANYTAVNDLGTAVLLEQLADQPVERLVVASSMSIYGEGLYRSASGALRDGQERSFEQLKAGRWELEDEDGSPLTPVPTPETKAPALASIYALSKYAQERACLIVGRAYSIPTVALRFFNVYGPRQALSNPYTGVLAIFASRLLNGNRPIIFEDGRQRRDFVHVRDVARACRLALERPDAAGRVFNVGSGRSLSILDIAEKLSEVLGRPHLTAEITGRYRSGDIRHCFADLSAARRGLGFEPEIGLEEGLEETTEWLRRQTATDRFEEATRELACRGLAV